MIYVYYFSHSAINYAKGNLSEGFQSISRRHLKPACLGSTMFNPKGIILYFGEFEVTYTSRITVVLHEKLQVVYFHNPTFPIVLHEDLSWILEKILDMNRRFTLRMQKKPVRKENWIDFLPMSLCHIQVITLSLNLTFLLIFVLGTITVCELQF